MKTILLLLTCICLTSCSGTKYQPEGTDETGGYSFLRISEDVFKVEFHGNGLTPPKQANDFALLRAAEVCKEHAFKYFSILGTESNSKTDVVHLGSTSYSTGTVNTFGGYSGTTTTRSRDIPIFKPRPAVVIKCYTEAPGGHAGPVKEADAVIREIRTQYKLPLP